MSIETFDWQGYMSDIGYAPEEIPNEINDEDREWLYGLWARDLMEQLNYEAKQNPFLATSKEKANEARRQFLQYAPDLAHLFGEEVQPNNPDATFDPEEFRQHVVNNEVQNANLGYYLDTFAASRINEDTDVKWPWLKGLTKDQFKKSFMEQQDIDEAWTSVDDIRNGNFGTLAANYQAQLAQQQGLRGDEKSGHMAALKQGWYEFEKLFGYTAGTLGDATGIQWLSDIGNEIAQNVIQKSDAYNYQSKYNQSLADTIKNEGVMAAGGKILNMAEENWATTAAPLALAAIGKILSTYAHVPQPLADAATRAVAANVVRRQGANLLRRASQLAYGSSAALSGLEIGGVRAELEEKGKYDPDNVADVVAAGLVSSSLDFIGNVAAMKGLTITAGRLWRSNLATMEARSRLAKEIAEDQAKSFTHRVLSAMATEGVTEGLQEIPAMVVGARRGIEYTSKEVRDRIIDAAAVGAFMGGGIRAGEIALEKYHRGDEESPTDTDADETPETPDAPEAPPQPSQPPPPDFDGEMPFNNVTYRPTENGFVAADLFNVGYGATRNEAAEDFLKNANKGRVDIDANDIRTGTFTNGGIQENWSVVRYGDNSQHSIRVIGQGNNALIRKIIDIHNNSRNAVNLQGHNTFNVSDFQSTNPDLNEDQFIRSVLEQKKTGRGSSNDVILNRTNAVDIPVTLTAIRRTDRPGSYAAFNLDQDTRDALKDKGFTVLSNPKSRENGRIQKLLLYRDGFVYTVTLRNSATDDNVSAVVEAEHIKDINARRQIKDKDQNKKAKNENIKRNSLEMGVKNQILRVVTIDLVTDISSTTERKSSITIAPVLRAGFVEVSRKVNAEGVEEISLDPRKILEQRVKKANGKIESIGARGITYTSGGETTRLDVTADGRVVVSTDGRFVGDYEFYNPADFTEGERRASFQSTRIEATQPFHVIEIPEELQFDGRVTFVYEGDINTPENKRNYYAIRNNGDVYYLSPADENYVKRLLKLQYIQNLNDARDVFGNQFIEFYALPSFYEDGDVNQFVGFKTENNLLPVVNLEDPTLHRFSNMEVDDLISAGYNGEFVKVYAIIAPNGEVVRATTEEGVDAFIEDIKGYANILDDSEWNPSSRRESIFGDAYTERGLYTDDDIYDRLYSAAEIYVNDDGTPFTDEDFNGDSDEIRKASENIISELDRDISSIRDQYRKGKIHLSDARIRNYESTLSRLRDSLRFFASSPSQYASQYFNGAREFNEVVRRRFYVLRTAQAMLRIDLYKNKLGSYTSILNRQELDRIIANDIGNYNEGLTFEQLREKAIQAESIAVRLEEAYIKTFPLNDASKTTTLLWQSIYSDPVEGNYGSFVNRIHSEGTDFRFSRAAETPRIQRKEAILDELRKELGDFTLNEMLEKGLRGESGGLFILPDQEAAHEIERRFTTDATQPYYDNAGLIQGFVAPDGMIYLVEDGIVDGKARQIILHEYGVHARKFGMTDAQFQEVVQNIKAKRDEKSLEGDFIRHAITRAKQANKNMSEDNPIFWEEVAAYAVEDGYHLADTGIVGRMQTWMKNWLWRFGVIDATAFHYQDFVNMAQGMLGNPGPLSFFDGTHDYTKYQDSWKNISKFSRAILAEDTPDREEFAQRTYRRLRGLDDAIERERNGEDADTIEQATDWRRNDNGDWSIRYSRTSIEGARRLDISDPRDLKEVVNGEPGGESEFRYSRATAEDLKPYKSFINDLEDNLVRERISGVPREGDSVLYQRGDVNEFITRDSLYTIEDAADYHPDLEQRWIDYHRDDSESNFVRYSRSIPETVPYLPLFPNYHAELEEIAQRQYEEIRNRYYGTEEWLKVRDKNTGELVDSALPERLWVQVRTPLFKNWFGDWENDPQNASVVVDEYGEPKVVYHGTGSGGFTVFEGRMWFVDDPDVALSYSTNADAHIIRGQDLANPDRVLPLAGRYGVFLNIRNPLEIDFKGETFSSDRISRDQLPQSMRWRNISPNSYAPTTEVLAAAAQNEGYDGSVFHNVVDPGSYAEEVVGGDEFDFPVATVYVTEDALQVRSATDNVGVYGAGGSRDFRYSRAVSTGEQKQAGVLYPDASEEIQAIRYSRQSAEEILRRERPQFTDEQVNIVLDELDKYSDDEKKQKLVLHWVIRGQLRLPEDTYKIGPAMKYAASNLKIDPYQYSPQEIINRYQKANPSGTPIRPGRKVSENDTNRYIEDEFPGIFTDFKDHGDGIVSYQVQNSRTGQRAMRKIINTHWGKNQSPWCLLYANNQGELRDDAWDTWLSYSAVPKRVAFKNGDLISFMAISQYEDEGDYISVDPSLTPKRALDILRNSLNRNLTPRLAAEYGFDDYLLYDTLLRKFKIEREGRTLAGVRYDFNSILNNEEYEEAQKLVVKYLPEKVKENIIVEGYDWKSDRDDWEIAIRNARAEAEEKVNKINEEWAKTRSEIAEKFEIRERDDGTLIVVDDKGRNASEYTWLHLPEHFYFSYEHDRYVPFREREDWYDRDDHFHPDLNWARDASVHGLRYSRTATISTPEDSLPQTPRQRGMQVPNAPGMYKMPDGSLHIEPSELPVGFESETILYAAIAVSDPAKEEPKIAELRGLITVDEDLMRETDRMMRERNDTNEDHRLGYAVSLILEAYDPTSDIYQQTVDAFHEAVSKATGGAYQNLVLDTGQIEAAAHAAAGIPYEALLTAPQETVPTPRPDTADVQRQQLEEAFANSDAQREYMQVGEDGRPFIATDDSDVDVVFESRVTNPFTTGELADKVLVETTEHTESDDFYNHLADSPHHGTQEPLDTGHFTAQADTMRNEVEAFLASVLPEHIWNRMQILWEDNAENRKLLGNALGNFNIKAWQNKNILVRGWDRSFGQVVRTAAREASRFGWGLWQNRDFRKALTDFYDMYTARIHEELRPYYNQMGVTDPTKLTNGQKIFMVQTFFSKLNQSLFTDDATNMADILGIDAQEYKRVLANVKRGISAQENDLSPFMQGVAGDPELAKQFAREMLRMTMETATNVGTHFVYERANTLGGKDRIHVYTNEWGTWRNTEPNTRFGEVAQQIKENLAWWQKRYKGSPRAERFARWMMRNAPVWMEYPFKWMHLYVPSARLGDTTLGKASQMISRVWQRIGDMSGTTIQQDYALMEDIHGILRDHGYDPLVADDMFDQRGRRITYEQFFRGLGITSAKAMEKARLADEVVRTAEQLRKEQAANIRSIIVETGVSLYNRMVNAGVPQRNIEAMVNNFERKRQRYHDNYSHRMYEAFTPEGKSELSRMLHYLKRDPATGELTIAKRARQAEEKIRQAEARYGRGTSQFYKETVEARKDLRRYERLTHLQNFVKAVVRDKKRLFGAEFNEAVVAEMKNTINAIVLDAQSIGRVDTQAVPHYNSIAAQKARKLDPSKAHHRELMAFLSEIKDPMRIAVYSADQQRQIIAKLQFNKELGEYLVDNNMASVRGVPNTESIARDLAQMESGTFLEYINVDPEFMPEIKAEWENMQKVTETVLGGLTDAVKANSTVYSLRLAMNNYIGNASMLLASGHFWRFGNWMEAGGIVRKQFLDRFTYGAKDPSDFGKMIIKEMEDAMITGGSGTEMSVFQLNKGAHEKFVQMMTELLYGNNLITRAGKFKVDNFVKRSLEYARKFYTYGDEWVKPLMYINNRMNAIAKYKAIEKRQNGETEEEYNDRVLKKAIEEASEMTIRETVSWENSPFFVRQLSTKSVRFFVPDFLLHNFQMLRITASNYVRLMELGRELLNFNPTEMNPDKVEEYRSALKKEFAQRSVGGAMTAGVYAGLAGATGSCMAFIPYMMNTLMAAIDGEDDKDKDNTFFNPQQWEGAQRILNYKTGGDNFFVPAWMHDGKIYAWNYGRASVMLTHAIPQPATENPEFTDYAAQFFKNIVNIGGGTIAQEIVNNFQGKDKWGRDIGMEAGWGRIFDRVIVPGAVRQLLDMSIGYPGSSDNPYREGKAIKMSDAVGITVNAYDMRDIVNELGWDMDRVGSNSQNVVRKSFVKRLTQSDALSDSDVASMVSDMREDNGRHMDRANYLLTGLRQMGMENKDIQHWLTISRKDANTILSKKQATAFLKGHNVYDDALVTYLKNRRNNLAKGKDDVRMSGEELATVLQNYDKAIRIYSQALQAR